MQRYRKEPCRNFQRGFCQYGERCKFLHQVTQQQFPKSNNTNPFGFGVQNHSQPRGSNSFPNFINNNNQQQYKPFENKWSRSQHQQQQQPDPRSQQVTNHQCTDPESCKRLIAEDFQNERPLWKLTCYGHWKGISCDIVGDISYEELQAAAYDDAKCGLSLQSIVERERNLLNSKLLEFENLLRNPYKAASKSGHGTNPIFPTGPTNVPPSVSSFSQLGASLNLGGGVRPSIPSSPFGQSNSISNPNQFFRPSTPSNNTFVQPNPGQTLSQFGTRSFPSLNSGPMGNHHHQQPSGNSFAPNLGGFVNSWDVSSQTTSWAGSTQNSGPSTVPSHTVSNGPGLASVAAEQANANVQSINNIPSESVLPEDASIWSKEKWTAGEIPEQAPPDVYIH